MAAHRRLACLGLLRADKLPRPLAQAVVLLQLRVVWGSFCRISVNPIKSFFLTPSAVTGGGAVSARGCYWGLSFRFRSGIARSNPYPELTVTNPALLQAVVLSQLDSVRRELVEVTQNRMGHISFGKVRQRGGYQWVTRRTRVCVCARVRVCTCSHALFLFLSLSLSFSAGRCEGRAAVCQHVPCGFFCTKSPSPPLKALPLRAAPLRRRW